MSSVIVLFTQDLRVHDHPALTAAVGAADTVLPVFVVDPRIVARSARNRCGYLAEALADLRAGLRARGGDLVVREGDTVVRVRELAALTGSDTVFLTAGVSRCATRREDRLRGSGLTVRALPGLTVVPPGGVTPAGGDHYRVFTPYWRAWAAHERRPVLPAPDGMRLPGGVEPGSIPAGLAEAGTGAPAPDRLTGGEAAARERLRAWLDRGLTRYAERRDDLPAAATSRLSADLRFGCLSPLEVAEAAEAADAGPGAEEFVRQLAWRDFHHQVVRAFPELPERDYRSRGRQWRTDPDALDAWRRGRTGVPIVDAGMRQLLREGFVHNRARMIAAAFLTRTLRVHWRAGADHFDAHLVDGDVADDYGNWQWVAGTGNDTRPNRPFNPLRQARRFDPEGDYVRRHVPELRDLPGGRALTPWREPEPPDGYPPPVADPGR
ncbi:deoxyribodipyrimidine photo-lyase [Nocardiopsis sp. FIRDI 009]|uniref:cryptochrome/photolyase family protein n=1 Tax=Nocardiopsis sp. FIRDI 009 TaxID=714197 RepID=UPI000E26E11F|nr:deoxyribodipyrimidine photo-lyase [Nocardiopsis sp. FIRDI 009]